MMSELVGRRRRRGRGGEGREGKVRTHEQDMRDVLTHIQYVQGAMNKHSIYLNFEGEF